MATSESDDFESADEELSARRAQVTSSQKTYKKCIGSDSDDDVDFIPVQSKPSVRSNKKYSVPPNQRRRFHDKNNENSGKKFILIILSVYM